MKWKLMGNLLDFENKNGMESCRPPMMMHLINFEWNKKYQRLMVLYRLHGIIVYNLDKFYVM